MQALRTLVLGQKGARKFLEHYSKQLICVRHRYGEQRREHSPRLSPCRF
jgi:hypothetical protein